MRIAHCAIDTSLNFKQANTLIQELKPATLVIPECYTQPPSLAPTLTDYVIEKSPDRTLIPYKWGEVCFKKCLNFIYTIKTACSYF